MAFKEIEQWASIINESDAEIESYNRACRRNQRLDESHKRKEQEADEESLALEELGIKPSDFGDTKAERCLHTLDDAREGSLDEVISMSDFEIEDDTDAFEDDYSDDKMAYIIIKFEPKSWNKAWKSLPPVSLQVRNVLGSSDEKKIVGSFAELKELWAALNGFKDWNALVASGSKLLDVFWTNATTADTEDSLVEADWREACAHLLDPIGMSTSSASLAGQDTAQVSFIDEAEEEFEKELDAQEKSSISTNGASEIAEALNNLAKAIRDKRELNEEDDLVAHVEDELCKLAEDSSPWSGDQMKQLDKLKGLITKKQDAEDEFEDLSSEDQAELERLKALLALDDTPEDEILKVGKSGFLPSTLDYVPTGSGGEDWHITSFDPMTGGPGEEWHGPIPTFNHDIDIDKTYKQRRKEAEAAYQKDSRKAIPLPKRGQDTWTSQEWSKILDKLGKEETENLYNELVAWAEQLPDKKEAAATQSVLKQMFGKKATMADIASRFGVSKVMMNKEKNKVSKWIEDAFDALPDATKKKIGMPAGGFKAVFASHRLTSQEHDKVVDGVLKRFSDRATTREVDLFGDNLKSIIDHAKSRVGKRGGVRVKKPDEDTENNEENND